MARSGQSRHPWLCALEEASDRLADPFAPLRHRNFRLLFAGLVVANVGTQVQFVAQDYLVYTLTHQAYWLGIVDASGAATLILASFVGGAIADRLPKRGTLLVTQSLFLVTPVLMGVDILVGAVRPWHVVVFSVVSALVLAVDFPARQAILPRLVERERLMGAIALNSITFTAASAVGPALAGPVIAWAGVPAAFFVDGASSLAILAALLAFRLEL